MKTIILLITCIITTVAYAQRPEDANKFKVVDAATGLPIPYTTISILKARLAIATEADGTFYIPGNLAAMRDTVVIHAQTYKLLKMPLNKLAGTATVQLSKSTVKTAPARPDYSGKQTLNNYSSQDIGLYAGVSTENAKFNYIQIAQYFSSNTANNRLTSITVDKRQHWMMTKFRIRVYDVDPVSGGPGLDLCDKIIDVDNEDGVNDYLNRVGSSSSHVLEDRLIETNLRKYNIIIPGKSFFVAVEWLRDFFNAAKAPVYNKATNKVDTTIVFRPYIGISPIKGSKLNIWVMEVDRKWKLNDHFYPLGTDLAIKATVEY